MGFLKLPCIKEIVEKHSHLNFETFLSLSTYVWEERKTWGAIRTRPGERGHEGLHQDEKTRPEKEAERMEEGEQMTELHKI